MDFIYYQYHDIGFRLFVFIIILHVTINYIIYYFIDHNAFGPDIDKYEVMPPTEAEIQKLRKTHPNHRKFESNNTLNQLGLCVFTLWWFSSYLNDTQKVKKLKTAGNTVNVFLFVSTGLFLYTFFSPVQLESGKYEQIAKDKLYFIYFYKPLNENEKGIYGRKDLYKRLSLYEDYGYEYNTMRKMYNVPLIPKTWYTRDTKIIVDKKWKAHKNYSPSQTWSMYNDSISPVDGHIRKVIEFEENGTIKSETDFYRTSKYEVHVTFNYNKKEHSYFITHPDSMEIDKSSFERMIINHSKIINSGGG